MPTTSKKTITQVLDEFLAEQKARLKQRTFGNYESIIDLFKDFLNSYQPCLSDEEWARIRDGGGTFCETFGPDQILDGYSEFFGYFMSRKVMCDKETSKAAGTVLKKLAKWLAEKGYAEQTTAAKEQASEAANDLPAAQDVLEMLEENIDWNFPEDYKDEIQDHFYVNKTEPGKLWVTPLTMHETVLGPVPVPREVSQLCKPMWSISGTLVKVGRCWRFLEVWNVSP